MRELRRMSLQPSQGRSVAIDLSLYSEGLWSTVSQIWLFAGQLSVEPRMGGHAASGCRCEKTGLLGSESSVITVGFGLYSLLSSPGGPLWGKRACDGCRLVCIEWCIEEFQLRVCCLALLGQPGKELSGEVEQAMGLNEFSAAWRRIGGDLP